ncbi:MAG: SPOR domain-containing protein [Candidatus Omnitrophica bacterium]|nr:SPOR domain-containing protein [Candidatus Omnitrophota bacterium]
MIRERRMTWDVRRWLMFVRRTLSQTSYVLLLTSYVFFTVSLAQAGVITIADIQSAFMQKDYPKVKELTGTFTSQPITPQEKSEALYYSALSDLWLGQYAFARQTVQQVIDSKPSPDLMDKASLALIDTYYMEGDYKNSLNLAEDFLKNNPKSEFSSSVYLKVARSYLKLADWDKGRGYLEKIVNQYPNSLERFHVEQLLQESQFFAVQVGSFQERSASESLANELQNKGEYAYVVEANSPDGKKLYRVRVGKFQQFNEAQQLETKLAQLGYPTKIYP